ncbi:MAG: potassium/proton antiporter [Bdellovibrionales bacterium]|nr:potassium/proton antiporter [Bdellovibrionales bacterium]
MDKHFLQVMLAVGFLLLISVFASKTTSRFGVPILLIFIVVGMVSGEEGPGGMLFNDAHLTHIMGTIALSFILFSGGLSTDLKLISPVWKEGVLLATFGVLISTAIIGCLIHHVMGWGFLHSALLGAAISSTDAAAVFGILKTRKLGLKPRMQALLELESGSNDPMAVFLTLSLIQVILAPAQFSWLEVLYSFFVQMSLGGLAGWFLGLGLVKLINWLDLEFEGLYPVLTIAGVICIYSMTEYFGGNGFLSVYVAGLAMGSQKYFSKHSLGVFHDGLAWLMQVGMFLSMGLLVVPSEVLPVFGPGILFTLGLVFFARPISVALCLVPFKYSLREIWFVSWGGLRGAVPIILATYFLAKDIPYARVMFNIVFFIVVFSMAFQGGSLGLMSRWMKVQESLKASRKLPFKSRHGQSEFIEFFIGSSSKVIGQSIFQLHLPKDVLVVLILRQGKEFIPRGSTEIEPFDRLVCLSAKTSIPAVEAIFGSEHFLERRIG